MGYSKPQVFLWVVPRHYLSFVLGTDTLEAFPYVTPKQTFWVPVIPLDDVWLQCTHNLVHFRDAALLTSHEGVAVLLKSGVFTLGILIQFKGMVETHGPNTRKHRNQPVGLAATQV